MEIFKNSWDNILKDELEKDYYRELRTFLIDEYTNYEIYPGPYEVYKAMRVTPYEDVKVVILGQDPYHGEGQAHGLAFSVKPGVKQPPSLVNIFKELQEDLGIERPEKNNGCLMKWEEQGVLLLNTSLTVRAHQAGSHRGKGWETFTDAVISKLNERKEPIVFILWGNNAKSKEGLITENRHLILKGSHPSPLSAYNGFFGGHYFSRTNAFLKENGREPIDWDINEPL